VVADLAGVFFAAGFFADALLAACAVVFDVEGDVPAVSVAASLIAGSSRQANIAARRIRMLRNSIA
jgi:hypothetical protein